MRGIARPAAKPAARALHRVVGLRKGTALRKSRLTVRR
jgi:hypothetical protein